MAPIRLALLGTGIFAREAHLPALKALADRFEVVAIYSRSAANARVLASSVPHLVDTYSDIAPVLAQANAQPSSLWHDLIRPQIVQPVLQPHS
jgi:predicted dehydrogenase